MNIKYDIKQKKLILDSLFFQKRKMENAIYSLNSAIEIKKESLIKFEKYKQEYTEKMYLRKIQKVIFIRQFESFLAYINHLIDSQSSELLSLDKRKEDLQVKYNILSKKIDGISDLMSALKAEQTKKIDNNIEHELLTTFNNKKKENHG